MLWPRLPKGLCPKSWLQVYKKKEERREKREGGEEMSMDSTTK
jgi:hypothetical protein